MKNRWLINELLMKYRNKVHLLYSINKRELYGIKFYKLCNSKMKYIHKFRIQKMIEKDKSKKD